MPTAPLYRRGDVVYLLESALIGKLDAFKITSIKQVVDGRWVYEIDIAKKPPHQATVGDTYDVRIDELTIAYLESELVTLCEALNAIIDRLQRQVTSVADKIAGCCPEDLPPTPPDAPRWGIGSIVYFDASARLGFFQCAKVTGINEIGVQPGSRQTRYTYTTDTKNGWKQLYFREDELISFCEAALKVQDSVQRDLDNALAQQATHCS